MLAVGSFAAVVAVFVGPLVVVGPLVAAVIACLVVAGIDFSSGCWGGSSAVAGLVFGLFDDFPCCFLFSCCCGVVFSVGFLLSLLHYWVVAVA
jgi:hypothetical protein